MSRNNVINARLVDTFRENSRKICVRYLHRELFLEEERLCPFVVAYIDISIFLRENSTICL